MDELTSAQIIVVSIIPMIFAITVHETAHGWIAKKFGDNTASMQGRLTLNPIKHIDFIGTIVIPFLTYFTGFIFGWAKPVPVDARNFKNPRRDMAIVALAGPASNLLMAVGWALLIYTIGASDGIISLALTEAGKKGIYINLSLAILNLLPIPPLDGSRILTGILPSRLAWQYNQLERYGFIILLVLLYTKVLNPIIEYPLYLAEKLIYLMAGMN
jgi:Zn-dependent protease